MGPTPDTAHEYPPVYRQLMLVGLLGAAFRRSDDARAVADAIEATLDSPHHWRLHCALAQGIGGDTQEARQILEQQPDDDPSKVAAAVALLLAGDPEWKPLLDNVLVTSMDSDARVAAVGVMQLLLRIRTQ